MLFIFLHSLQLHRITMAAQVRRLSSEENGGEGQRKRGLESRTTCLRGSEERSGRRKSTSWGVSTIAEATYGRRPQLESTRPWPPSHWHSSQHCAHRWRVRPEKGFEFWMKYSMASLIVMPLVGMKNELG